MPGGLQQCLPAWIETFQSRLPLDPTLDLQPQWLSQRGASGPLPALEDPWGALHRPDWAARGLIIWPRGGQWQQLRLTLVCPEPWRRLGPERAVARLCLRWWADAMALRVDGEPVRGGDLFDTACRWSLPGRWWAGEPLELELGLRSPCHDDGALIHSRLELEPLDPADPDGLLAPTLEALAYLRRQRGWSGEARAGSVQVLGHAHLDLAWLWPVADTWRAAERTFVSTLELMERFPQLHFGHSTPALYAWLERQRPALFARIRAAMRAGRWEPLNGPWVESDCVLIDTASLLRQFQEGQHYSRRAFPEWRHHLAWLPDSFGFAAGLPAVAAATGVRWFCTHKLAWNATNPFPHRLFRWRSRCGSEVLALMTAAIGTDGDPLAIETHRLDWQRATGIADALWLPGVGDHGGGPTAEMLEQLALWQRQPAAAPQRHGSLRSYLERLEPLASQLPVWRDELYLELHRGCATSRPDQKRHNRTLERLLREAELARSLLLAGLGGAGLAQATAVGGPEQGAGDDDGAGDEGAGDEGAGDEGAGDKEGAAIDWRPLLFQQFHDILPGTSIPEVFEQAEPQWRAARRRSCRQRDRDLQALLSGAAVAAAACAAPLPAPSGPEAAMTEAAITEAAMTEAAMTEAPAGMVPPAGGGAASPALPLELSPRGEPLRPQPRDQPCEPFSDLALAQLRHPTPESRRSGVGAQVWWVAQLQALPAAARTVRVPAGDWSLIQADGPESALPQQAAAEGGVWIQLPVPAGVAALVLRRLPPAPPISAGSAALAPAQARTATAPDGGLRPPQPASQPQPPPQPPSQPLQPVHLRPAEELGPDHWRLGNGLIEVLVGPAGVEQLFAGSAAGPAEALLAAPLRWQRWADRGEFWDAWDLAADHRRHPLPWDWRAAPELISAGPLAVQFCWRGLVGASPVRLELRLLAGSPWLELVLCQQWRQRHELLQLEIPLARQAERWAADTSAGVVERPAAARTPREQARWEVPAISWLAGAGLAVLLDGPQGVSADVDRLSVSLLRAPTWPDPGADNGWQRQRLGLMAAPAGWRPARVPQQARRLREPLWLRPCLAPATPPIAILPPVGPLVPALADDLRLVGLRPADGRAVPVPAAAPSPGPATGPSASPASLGLPSATDLRRADQTRLDGPWADGPGIEQPGPDQWGAAELVLSVQNEGPCRRRLALGAGWQVLERLDGLDRPRGESGDSLSVAPWQLAFWRIRRGPTGT
ncbi:MAG: alpha-mannosidase [Cyanobium sp.]